MIHRKPQRTSRRLSGRHLTNRVESLERRLVLSAAAAGHLEFFQTHRFGAETAVFTWDPVEVDPAPEADFALSTEFAPPADFAGGSGSAAPIPITELPALESNPGAPVDLYLDLNGHYEPQWGAYSNATTPVYDIDGDDTTFSETELSRIQTAWEMVSEDFAPFNINVTTVEPAVLADGVPADQANGVALRVAIGGSWQDWYGGSAGGVGYIDAFTSSVPNVVYVFSDNVSSYLGPTSSHEAGHGFGLRHQSVYDEYGVKIQEYNSGDGTWSPIMGSNIASLSKTTTWHNGTNSQGPTVYQDDMALLARSQNGFGYRGDDHGDTSGLATPLAFDGTYHTGHGIIETNNDVDVFRISPSVDKTHRFIVDVDSVAPNLDTVLELRDSSGSLMASAAPSDDQGAQFVALLAAGQDYYLHVTKTSAYGFVGQYSVTVLEVADGPHIVASTGEGFFENAIESVRISFAESIDASTLGVDDVQLTGPVGEVTITGIAPVAGSGDTQFDIQFATQTTPGIYDLIVAPDIADASGNLMNQDQDEFAGELSEDGYAGRFSITAPGSSFLVASSEGSVYVHDVEVDGDGYVYLTGVVGALSSTYATADFDPGPGSPRSLRPPIATGLSPNTRRGTTWCGCGR